MKLDKIVFYHPSQITGGTEYLFLRCAEYLAENQKNYAIFIVDYDDGFYRRNVKTGKIHFIEYNSQYKTQIPDGSCVVVQLNIITKYNKLFFYDKRKSCFLYWALHMRNIKAYIHDDKLGYSLFRWEKKKLGIYLARLAECSVIKFMGCSAYAIILRDFYQKPRMLEWLPNIVPMEYSKPEPLHSRISNAEIKFCWLGRLDFEKARNVETYMNELERLSSNHFLSLSIIGDGPAECYLKDMVSKYTFPIYFVGEKKNDDLDTFMRTQTEIGLASGTSAMEFALRGKPVIYEGLLDRVYHAGERKQYYLYSESQNIRFDDCGNIIREGASDFASKVEQILSNYEQLSQNEYEKVKEYSAENCGTKLINNVNLLQEADNCEISAVMDSTRKLLMKGYYRRQFLRRLFGLPH